MIIQCILKSVSHHYERNSLCPNGLLLISFSNSKTCWHYYIKTPHSFENYMLSSVFSGESQKLKQPSSSVIL